MTSLSLSIHNNLSSTLEISEQLRRTSADAKQETVAGAIANESIERKVDEAAIAALPQSSESNDDSSQLPSGKVVSQEGFFASMASAIARMFRAVIVAISNLFRRKHATGVDHLAVAREELAQLTGKLKEERRLRADLENQVQQLTQENSEDKGTIELQSGQLQGLRDEKRKLENLQESMASKIQKLEMEVIESAGQQEKLQKQLDGAEKRMKNMSFQREKHKQEQLEYIRIMNEAKELLAAKYQV
jgi:hypothetical protein